MSAIEILRRVVPASWRPTLRRSCDKAIHAGVRRKCNVCGAHLRSFQAYGTPPEPDFLCPVCRSKPPHRLTALWFVANRDAFGAGKIFVHVAPEPGLAALIQRACRSSGMSYRAGGLSGAGEAYLDLRCLDLASSSVDLFFCCHVLNSMAEDETAMREIHRVLAADGVALLQVPAFESRSSTTEPPDEEGRLREFGDKDIYRRYTNEDYRGRLERAGFQVGEFRASEVPRRERQRYRLMEEVLHVCTKA